LAKNDAAHDAARKAGETARAIWSKFQAAVVRQGA